MRTKGHGKISITIITFIFMLIFSIITVTFAWLDYNQYKANTIFNNEVESTKKVVLIEDFIKPDNWDQNINPKVSKKVYVENIGDVKVYLRLELKDYMEYIKRHDEITNLRYMIDERGDFIKAEVIKGSSAEDILKILQLAGKNTNHEAMIDKLTIDDIAGEGYHDIEAEKRIHRIKTNGEKETYMIATKAEDANGQYGKHVILGPRETLDTKLNINNIITGAGAYNEQRRPQLYHQEKDHNIIKDNTFYSDDYLYDNIDFNDLDKEDNEFNILRPNEHARKYIDVGFTKWTEGYQASSIEDNKWLYHEGYYYYSSALEAQQATNMIIDHLYLKRQPAGIFSYINYIHLEALTLEEITDNGEWENIPPDLEEKYVKDENDKEDKPVVTGPSLPGSEGKDVGDTIKLGNRDFIIIYKDKYNRALVQSQKNLSTSNTNYYPFGKDVFTGVKGSYPQRSVDSFYRGLSRKEKEYILPFLIHKEEGEINNSLGSNYIKQELHYSYPSNNGVKGAFVLGVSDINKYIKNELSDDGSFGEVGDGYIIYDRAVELLNPSGGPYWLRSPGRGGYSSVIVSSYGTGPGAVQTYPLDTTKAGARASLWVQLAE